MRRSRVAQRPAVVRIPGFAFDETLGAVQAASAEVRQSSGEGTRSNSLTGNRPRQRLFHRGTRSNSLTGNAAAGSWKTVHVNRRLGKLLLGAGRA